MAKVFLDFDDYTTNAFPSTVLTNAGWHGINSNTRVQETVEGANAVFGAKELNWQRTSDNTNFRPSIASPDYFDGSFTDVQEIVAVIRSGDGDSQPHFVFHGSGNSTSKTGYSLAFRDIDMRVTRRINESSSNSSYAYPEGLAEVTTGFFARARCTKDGNNFSIAVTLWNFADSEPSEPTFTYTNNTSEVPQGWMGVGHGGIAVSAYFGSVGFATGGDVAPLSLATPGLIITDIKEPNEVNEAIVSAEGITVNVYQGSSISGEPDDILTGQEITGGTMELDLSGTGIDVDDTVTVTALWTEGSGATEEKRFFAFTGTVIDLDDPGT